jgi:hypothetical protein
MENSDSLIYQIRDKKPECSIFWIPSTSIERIGIEYRRTSGFRDYKTRNLYKNACQSSPELRESRPMASDYYNVNDMNIWLSSDGSSPSLTLFSSRPEIDSWQLNWSAWRLSTFPMDDEMATDLLRVLLIHKNWRMTTKPLLNSCASSVVYHWLLYKSRVTLMRLKYLTPWKTGRCDGCLSLKNYIMYKTGRPNRKLDDQMAEKFRIIRKVRNSYHLELQLPPSMKIHSICILAGQAEKFRWPTSGTRRPIAEPIEINGDEWRF